MTNGLIAAGRGATDAQIAERLFLSINTMRSHLEFHRVTVPERAYAFPRIRALLRYFRAVPVSLRGRPAAEQRGGWLAG
jgi:hypothetical protein